MDDTQMDPMMDPIEETEETDLEDEEVSDLEDDSSEEVE